MSALDFPSSPVNGQTFVDGPRIWTFNSVYGVWNITSEGITGPTGYTGSFGTTGYTGSSIGASTNTQIIFNDSGAANGASGFTFIKTTNATSFPGTLAAGNTTITGFANVSTTLQVGTNTATFGTAAYIVANGNLGIGTTAPSSKLDVVAAAFTGGPLIGARYNTANFRMGIGIANLNGFPFVGVNVNNAADDNGTFDINGRAARLRMSAGTFQFETSSASGTAGNAITWNTSAYLDASGNLGIGTSSPGTKLEVADSATVRITVRNTTGSVITQLLSDNTSGYLGTESNHPLSFYTNQVVRATITAAGNVGIGTTAPAVRLELVTTSNAAAAEVLRLSNPGSGANTAAQIKFLAAGTNYGTITGGYGVAASQMTFNLPAGAGNYVWQQASAEKMVLDSSGNLSLNNAASCIITGNTSQSISIFASPTVINGTARLELYGTTAATNAKNAILRGDNVIFTNEDASETMRISAAGSVLVGTTTAHNKLTVSVSSANAAAGVLSLVNPNDGVGTAADLDFVIHSSAVLPTGRIRGLAAGADNYPLSFWTYGGGLTEKMRIDNVGNVGIGTSSPGGRLTVTNTSSTNLLIEKNGLPETYNPATFSSKNAYMPSGTQENWGTQSSVSTVAGYLVDITAYNASGATDVYFGALAGPYVGSGGPANFVFGRRTGTQTWAETMRISDTGNVGIGTTTPGYKLEVNGSFAATTKSFVIDHPTKPDMKLRYGSLEGPENGVYIRGKLNGKNIIELPDYWTGLIDEDTITVNLTPIGRKQDLFVKDISNNQINIGGTNVYCFFTVFAERKDVEKLIVEF